MVVAENKLESRFTRVCFSSMKWSLLKQSNSLCMNPICIHFSKTASIDDNFLLFIEQKTEIIRFNNDNVTHEYSHSDTNSNEKKVKEIQIKEK